MAIHPRYAHAILSGTKRVEFRKRRLAADVRVVLIYATAPIKRVIGAFEIEATHVDSPERIWHAFGAEGLIEHDAYNSYYEGRDSAVALRVQAPWRFDEGLQLSDVRDSLAVPQSFIYLELSALSAVARLVARQEACHPDVRATLEHSDLGQAGLLASARCPELAAATPSR